MDKRTITALKLIAFAELGMAVFLCWCGYHFYSTLERPVAGMRVTFEMYQAQFTFILIILQLLLITAGILCFFGGAIFYYLKKERLPNK